MPRGKIDGGNACASVAEHDLSGEIIDGPICKFLHHPAFGRMLMTRSRNYHARSHAIQLTGFAIITRPQKATTAVSQTQWRRPPTEEVTARAALNFNIGCSDPPLYKDCQSRAKKARVRPRSSST